jgi:hypothetical protein
MVCRGVLFLVAAVAMFVFARAASATERTVWRIGVFDQSPAEFNTGRQGAPLFGSRYPKGDLVYVVGKSNPANDWPGYQASTVDEPGGHPHPYTIQFDLKNASQGVYRLKFGLLSETARVAALRVEINGHAGVFYQHPKLSYSGGDRDMVTLPTAGADTITFDVPRGLLRNGTNRISLTALDERVADGGETHSAIAYDAIELDQDAEATPSDEALSAEVEPTIYYVRRGTGLSELVDIYVRAGESMKGGDVTLSVGGKEFRHSLSAEEFGEQRVEVEVPEFTAPVNGELTVKAADQAKRLPVELTPGKKWNLLVVPNAHLDIGYTDYQAKIAEIQSRILDEAIGLVDEHPDFRYSADGYWSVRQFMKGRSEEDQQKLFQAIEEKKIFVPTVEASLLTGVPSLEVLIRSLYPAFEFHQQHGGDANYVSITDVPTYSWSYESVLAAAGMKYFAAGSNMDDAPTFIYGRLNERSPFYWQGPDGSRTLMWYSWDYAQLYILFGGYRGDLAAGRDAIPVFLQAFGRPSYKSDSVIVYGSQWENTDLVPRQARVVGDWNKVYAYPHLQYSGFADALQTVADGFGKDIPVIRGTGGSYWEFGLASEAHSTAIARENEQRGPAAEEFSTVGSLVDPNYRPESDVLKQMWHKMVLSDEHTGDADFTVFDPQSEEARSQQSTKEGYAEDARNDLNYVLRRSLANLTNSIDDPTGTLLVFNPLSWQRSSLVETDLHVGRELVDLSTNQPVPYQVLSSGEFQQHIRFMAKDVPSVGYKAYAMRRINRGATDSATQSTTTMENEYYRVVLDAESGSVKSIFDKELKKELVNPSSPYRFDEYVYVTGGDKVPNRLMAYTETSPIPQLTVHTASGGHVVSVIKEPFGMVATLESMGVNTPKIETEILLFNGQKKIEFINHVHKAAVFSKEGVYFAFPLAMEHPQFTYETQNGFVNPAKDELPGAANMSFTVQHWVSADEDGVSAAIVPIDANLMTLGDVIRGDWPREFGQRPGNVFSLIMNNYWYTNFALEQGGDFTFRYVFTSGRNLEPGYLSRFGREEMSPLEVDQITPQDKNGNPGGPLNSADGSFLKVDDPDVALVTWKDAEDGKGMILRFVELAGREAEVHVEAPLEDVKGAWMADALERDNQPLRTTAHGFQFSANPFEIVTVRLQGAAAKMQQAAPLH